MRLRCEQCQEYFDYNLVKCPKCGFVKTEYRKFIHLVAENEGICAFSGAPADLRLPSGDYVCGNVLEQGIAEGWFDANLTYIPPPT